MRSLDLNDTIAAIATTPGDSGIGIIRISGSNALEIADKIFSAKSKKNPSEFKNFTVHYGWIVDDRPSSIVYRPSTSIIDEVLLTVMRAPYSYTREDIVEVSCHGGIVAMRRVLELVLAKGCRLAEPGEFTKRAFLNGRIDLTQAEAVLDIIRAKTDSALRMGVKQLEGGVSKAALKIQEKILEVLSFIEAQIDFPEEDAVSTDTGNARKLIFDINQELLALISSSSQGKIMREGIRVVICGKPNVGKSSLLNALLRIERSIVTSMPGTTRDTIEEILDIRGIPVRIVDTAGILNPRDVAEAKAVSRAKEYIKSADLILFVIDAHKKLSLQDYALMRLLKKKKVIAVLNKIDLVCKVEIEKITKIFPHKVELSAKKSLHIEALEEAIAEIFYKGKLVLNEPVLVSNQRHIELLKKAQKHIAASLVSLDNKVTLECISQDLKEGLSCLEDILGKKFSDDILSKIFSKFCIGK